ncbi:hypothetical protein DVH26_32595 [Paenibacillus sp. H1-7]|uniref:hypothetical protein n=1 Tax=Paenibacillus sp. H1-7 TaxID=2282849 RepID=UPI001EF992DA|nr:hypothetical protein [Paenibacillus sp. H1-7]ULL18761.1 hypothetical protein DVH26_32595 [Paenibacillus sp. H1-7]
MRKLSEMVARTGVQVYREIIFVFLLSMISSAVLVPVVLLLPVAFAFIALIVLYVPLCTGVIYACHRKLQGERAGIRAMLAGAGKYYLPSLLFGLVCALFVLILVSSWWYYGSKNGTLYLTLAVFQTYFVAMFFVSQLYVLPLVVQEKAGIFTAMGRSMKLFVAHPMYTIGAFIQAVSMALLLGLTVIGFGCLYLGMLGMFLNQITANVLPGKEAEAVGSENGRLSADASKLFPREG